MKNKILKHFLLWSGLSNYDVGVSKGGTVFPEIRPGAGFETGDGFVEEHLGGLP